LRKKIQTKDRPYSAPKGSDDVLPLSWDAFYDNKQQLSSGFCVYTAGDVTKPLVLLLHGAGLGAMSWAVVASKLKTLCYIVSYDCRGHGDTIHTEDEMSHETLVNDAKTVLSEINPQSKPVVLIGHSMGGAIAIRTALALPKGSVAALVVVDVVEGTAMAALPKMMSVVKARPQKFNSVSSAIGWA